MNFVFWNILEDVNMDPIASTEILQSILNLERKNNGLANNAFECSQTEWEE